jgi:phosphoribosylglycinamide formyltransferase 1
MLRIAVLVSGGGSNLQAILDAIDSGKLDSVRVELVISSNREAYALKRAESRGIPTMVIDAHDWPGPRERDDKLLEVLNELNPDLIVLAGYMKILPESIVGRFPRKIINIHPSLIPQFCGEGFYGMRVHRAVLEAGETTSGATVHYVDDGVDTGEILLQQQVPVLKGDTPESLAARVLETEHRILPEVINRLSREVK